MRRVEKLHESVGSGFYSTYSITYKLDESLINKQRMDRGKGFVLSVEAA
jgi:predicted Ser/Thr protein kinase